ncbi:ATPase [Secundilactobacillus kimchicus]|uniref:ATPase n=1 Tax=Secundilactobacillus kimchicus TaxID=528209 RepID=UPI0024A7DAC0|nr:ATPase [Secundilactobacillus kimchicus]
MYDSHAKTMSKLQARNDHNRQIALLDKLSSSQEIMKRLDTRIFVYGDTKADLDKRVKAIKRKLDRYGITVFIGELTSEFASIWTPPMKQELLPNRRKGTPVSAEVLGAGYLFNHVRLDDEGGSYFGFLRTRGQIMLNPLLIDDTRLTPYFMIAGRPRMGKSTFAKKLNDDVFARGGKLRIFDVKGEYIPSAKDQGGVVIALDGTENKINPFEVFPTATNEAGTEVDEIGSFNAHVQKIRNMFAFQNADATADDLNRLENLITDFYIGEGMWIKNPSAHREQLHVTGLPHDQYPQLGGFLVYLKRVQREYVSGERPSIEVLSINRIITTFQKMMQSEADIFDGITRISDFSDEDVVVFDVSGLKAHGLETFNCQVYSALSLLSADIVNNGKRYRPLYNNGQIETADIPYYWVSIDEFQNYAREEFANGLDWLASLMEEMAKDFCGVSIAMPTIKEILPADNIQINTPQAQRFYRAVSKIFGLMTYRCFFQLSDDDIPRLEQALGQSVTAGELRSVAKLRKHMMLLNINGGSNYPFTVEVTRDEVQRYAGGIG